MKNIFWLLTLVLFACVKSNRIPLKEINSVRVQNIVMDTLLQIRALEVYNEKAYFATATGEIGNIAPKLNTYVAKKESVTDSLNLHFRSLAVTNNGVFAMAIGSPAYLIKQEGKGSKVVYKEEHENAFYDAMAFWNDNEGIAIGDPTENCMSIIITRDGGETWSKIPCTNLPEATTGEAAFAASDTNIAIIGNKTWIATGGKASNILFSPDKGKTWQKFTTPIIQGKETTGMYSLDFYDANNGFAIGGDYTKPTDSAANKIVTSNGGKTWEVIANNMSPGYRSCVQYVPKSNAKQLVAVGFKGIDYSPNAGKTWKHLSDTGFYTLRFVNDSVAYAAGKGKISLLTFTK